MKKNIIKSIAFIVILIIILRVVSYIFTPKNNSLDAGEKEPEAMGILAERENSIDVVIYGDSEPMASIIPMQLWEDYGITAYSCSTSGQTLPDTCKYVYETLKKQNPKIVILETDNFYNVTEISVPIARVINILLPITEYHNRWKTLKPEDFFSPIKYTYTDIHRGYHVVDRVNPADDSNYMTYSEEVEKIPNFSKLYIKLIKSYVESKGAKFMMVSVPNTNNWNYARHNATQAFADEEGIEFLDLNYLKDEVKIDWKTETGDNGEHVNFWGAIKTTKHFGKWLNSKNILENHKNDPEFNNWNIDLKKVKEIYEKIQGTSN